MVWRFKYAAEINGSVGADDDLTVTNHEVNQESLNVLKRQWRDYYHAIESEAPVVNGSHAQFQTWLVQGANEWDAEDIYTEERHQAIMQKIGSDGVSRDKLLDGWINQESGRQHWGDTTPYRLRVGAAAGDSRGSIGFHQVQSRWIWGTISGDNCTQFSGKNLYAPSNGAAAIVWWGAKDNCGMSFRRAMLGNFDGDYDNSGTVKLRRSNHDSVALATDANYVTDKYERLSKGIAGYKLGIRSLNTTSWPELLKSRASDQGIRYAIEVKRKANINLRSYLWLDRDNNADFCFWYGEDDWYSSLTWTAARAEALTQTINEPSGRRVECP